MELLFIGICYSISILFLVTPLILIIKSNNFRKYFVYFICNTGFLTLNVVGLVSFNILRRQPSIDLYLCHLLISFSFFILYYILETVRNKYTYPAIAPKIGLVQFSIAKTIIIALLGTSIFSTILCSYILSPPLLFRFDLYGNWSSLVSKRIDIVLTSKFHWFALGIFEIPLFSSIFISMITIYQQKQKSMDYKIWRKYALIVISVSAILSIQYLNKQYIMYLMAALLLTSIIMANTISLKKLLLFMITAFFVLYALYSVYVGGESIMYISGTIFHRIFEVYPWASSIAFEIFPKNHFFLYGTSFINLFGLFDYQQVSVANMIYPYIYGNVGFGSAPLPALMENYVNWGWFGIIVGIAVMYFLIVFTTLLSWTKNLFHFSMSIYLTMKLILLWQVPFWFGTIEPTLVFLIVCLYVFYYICSCIVARRLPQKKHINIPKT